MEQDLKSMEVKTTEMELLHNEVYQMLKVREEFMFKTESICSHSRCTNLPVKRMNFNVTHICIKTTLTTHFLYTLHVYLFVFVLHVIPFIFMYYVR